MLSLKRKAMVEVAQRASLEDEEVLPVTNIHTVPIWMPCITDMDNQAMRSSLRAGSPFLYI